MREVPVILFDFMRDTLERAGVDTALHVSGLRLAGARTGRIGERVDWEELATFLNRCGEGLSDEQQEAIGEGYIEANRYWQMVAGLTVSPEILYRAGWMASRPAFPHMELPIRSLPDGRLELGLLLPDRYEPCPFFFRATVGELRALTRLLGLPDAQVEADVGPRKMLARVRLPVSRALPGRLAAAGREAAEQLVHELLSLLKWSFEQSREEPEVSPVLRLQRDHGLTHSEARVATRLAEGLSVDQIATELGVSVYTVRTHLKRAFAKTDTHRQAELVRLVLSGGDAA